MIRRVTIISIIILLFACKTTDLPINIYNAPMPPGTVKLENNLYFDKVEITNFYYLEFLVWTERMYGVNSPEYKSIFPDTTVWGQYDSNCTYLNTLYLRHPYYRKYPLVGISYEQAKAFSKWRSDRVMEYLLIKEGLIPRIPKPPKDSIFTIERYFKGQFYGIKPDPRFLVYPYYSLPDSVTYKKALSLADSINSKNFKYCIRKSCLPGLISGNCFENNQNYIFANSKYCQKSLIKKPVIIHLKGNVREMTNIKGVFFGRSFMDSCNTPVYIFRQDSSFVNTYTGFRNMCVYKKWEGK